MINKDKEQLVGDGSYSRTIYDRQSGEYLGTLERRQDYPDGPETWVRHDRDGNEVDRARIDQNSSGELHVQYLDASDHAAGWKKADSEGHIIGGRGYHDLFSDTDTHATGLTLDEQFAALGGEYVDRRTSAASYGAYDYGSAAGSSDRPTSNASSTKEESSGFIGCAVVLAIVLVVGLLGQFGQSGKNMRRGGHHFAVPETVAAPIARPIPLTVHSIVTLHGLGAVRIGMSVADAQAITGDALPKTEHWPSSQDCYYRAPSTGLAGVYFMIQEGRVVRIDVDNEAVTTAGGARVGDTEERILGLYGQRIEVQGHQYDPHGHYLVFVPQDAADSKLRLLFETDGKKVATYRVGLRAAVRLVEHCL